MVRVVILQPFYLPYSGVFELVRMADTFVLYDDVQFVRQNWQHRNRIKTASGAHWLTVPVERVAGQRINQAKIGGTRKWAAKHVATVRHAYSRSPYIDWVDERVLDLLREDWRLLVDLNLTTFHELCCMVGVTSAFLRSSEMDLPGSGSQRVLDVCRELGATEYLTGPAGLAYLDIESFQRANVSVGVFAYNHPVYPQQHGEFLAHLSIVDLLANCGPEAGGIIRGRGRSVPVGNSAQ
jgi:WbqC-like protein family